MPSSVIRKKLRIVDPNARRRSAPIFSNVQTVDAPFAQRDGKRLRFLCPTSSTRKSTVNARRLETNRRTPNVVVASFAKFQFASFWAPQTLRVIPFLRNAAILSKTNVLPILRATLIIPILTPTSTSKSGLYPSAVAIFRFLLKR